MSSFKWLSTAIALGTSSLVAGLAWTIGGHALLEQPPTMVGVLLACAAIGIIPAMIIWGAAKHYHRQLDQLSSYFETLNDDQPIEQIEDLKFGLDELKAGVESTLTVMRTRVRDLAHQRKQLEVRMRISDAQRRHLQAILNAISDPLIVTDAFSEVALANEAASQLFQAPLDQLQDRPIERVVREAELARLIQDARQSMSVGAAHQRQIEHRMTCNGQPRVFSITFSPVPAGDHRPDGGVTTEACCAGIVTILRDITREKEIAEMKSDFVSNVSHELRTPLSSIKAYMEMLVDGEAQDEQSRTEFYNVIQGETNRLSRLIDNILNISRIESGVVRMHREHLVLTELTREAIDVILPQARARDIAIHLHCQETGCQIIGDRDMLWQAVLNLLSNAVKYTPVGGAVDVHLRADPATRLIRLAVSDTGAGIPPADLPHIFEKFYRVADHKKLAKGTGLGLNLVKHVIERVHGGQIDVQSEVGRGSTFTLGLPMAENS